MDAADSRWMKRALELARRAEGATWPNPPVGAVIVQAGRKIGEGWHHGAGQPHAEVEAVKACAAPPRGATLYVTLEPCSTYGRTPPCTELILKNGIKRVVAGCVDPNPQHAGGGFTLLRQAGVEVVAGCREAECVELVAPFAKRLLQGLPYVTLKLGMTLDGKIADRRGTSQWITGEVARAAVQKLRRRADAVMVGAGTVRADDPSLLCRIPGVAARWRVVVDSRGRIPATARIFNDGAAGATLLCTSHAAATAYRAALRNAPNETRIFPFAARGGRLSLRAVLRKLAAEGLTHLLCEGGGDLAGGLLRAGLVDECVIFMAPAFLGDVRAVAGVRGADYLLARMPRFNLVEARAVGGDVMIRIRKGS